VPLRLVSAAVCALGAHALLYGAFRPDDGVHAYLGWYEPALGIGALLTLVVVRPAVLRTRLPVGEAARSVGVVALGVLLAQESLERSLEAGHPIFAAFTPVQWLLLLAGIALSALLLAVSLRAGQVVVSFFRRGHVAARVARPATWSVVTRTAVRVRPLAGRFALRAPPALA
jgi:hypothetical protein